MKSKNLLYAVALLGLAAAPHKTEKCNGPDLAVISIDNPEWEHVDKQSMVTVTFKNIGNQVSKPCRAMLYDVDISIEQAREMKLDTMLLDLIAENNALATYYTGNESADLDANSYDYDLDFSVFAEIPALKPGQKTTVTFYIPTHWIYDPNCEIAALADIYRTNQDCDLTNNLLFFFEWG